MVELPDGIYHLYNFWGTVKIVIVRRVTVLDGTGRIVVVLVIVAEVAVGIAEIQVAVGIAEIYIYICIQNSEII